MKKETKLGLIVAINSLIVSIIWHLCFVLFHRIMQDEVIVIIMITFVLFNFIFYFKIFKDFFVEKTKITIIKTMVFSLMILILVYAIAFGTCMGAYGLALDAR